MIRIFRPVSIAFSSFSGCCPLPRSLRLVGLFTAATCETRPDVIGFRQFKRWTTQSSVADVNSSCTRNSKEKQYGSSGVASSSSVLLLVVLLISYYNLISFSSEMALPTKREATPDPRGSIRKQKRKNRATDATGRKAICIRKKKKKLETESIVYETLFLYRRRRDGSRGKELSF